jgi:squalene-hopene/tetraprenyl-beta-curcumene cyclase
MRTKLMMLCALVAVTCLGFGGCSKPAEPAKDEAKPAAPAAEKKDTSFAPAPAVSPAVEPAAKSAWEKQTGPAVDRALHFLHANLQPDGSWEKNPGVTGIVVLAILKSGRGYNDVDDPFVSKPIGYLLSLQKADGGIYEHELANYTTSIALQALLAAENPKYKDAVDRARAFLLGFPLDESKGYEKSNPGYGGIGYGSTLRPDMSNAQMWADAVHAAEKAGLQKDSEAWKKVVIFASRCQNRSESNDMKWASNTGDAVYSPWESKAGTVKLADGREGLRGYGSMTYAFPKTMIYADVKKDDPRVQAACEWIRKNYTVDENPGLGLQGLFYYYHTMAKALKAFGEPVLVDDKGVSHDWRKDLAEKLLSLQKPDGSWSNSVDRWWEKDPTLVTAYVVLTLEELQEK